MIHTFDIEQNFWELYPDFKIALSFKDLYKRDKSRGKINSSKIMWFIVFTRDMNSKFYNLILDEKNAVIGEDYMGDINYYENNKQELDILINDYIKLIYSPSRKHLLDWDIKILERSEFIASQKYSIDNYEDLDKMAANTAKIYDTLKNIKEALSKEEGEGNLKGGGMNSLND